MLKLWFVYLFCLKSIQCWKSREESLIWTSHADRVQ